MIVTFYSFKGGVGRTLALANVGVVLAQRGHRVLVIDFDLEAPGLTRYLENVLGGDLQHRRGLLELLERQRDAGDAPDLLQEYTIEVLRDPEGGLLDLLASGRQDESYPQRVLDFDWAKFFSHDDGGEFFEFCRAKWAKQYDFVLIDSRTGITDTGGICTIQLPDIIVPVFTASRQSVDGVVDVVRRAQEGRQLLAYDRAPAAIVPLPSRFDSRTEYALSQQWLDEFAVKFEQFYGSWLPMGAPIRQVLERTKLPYVAFFSFGERLPVFEESGSDPESLSFALRTISSLLESGLQDVGRLTASSRDAADSSTTDRYTAAVSQTASDTRDRRVISRRLAGFLTAAAGSLLILIPLLVFVILSRGNEPPPNPVPPPTDPITVLAGHAGAVTSVAFSPDGRILASGSADATVRLWSLADPTRPVPLATPLAAHNSGVSAVAFAPAGNILASAGDDGTVLLWDISDPAAPTRLGAPLTGHDGAVTSVAFSPDGSILATAGDDGTVLLWDIIDPAAPTRLGAPLTGHYGAVTSVAFSPDGRILASGSADETVRLWNVATGQPYGSPLTGPTASITSVAFSPNGRILASGSADQTVALWNPF